MRHRIANRGGTCCSDKESPQRLLPLLAINGTAQLALPQLNILNNVRTGLDLGFKLKCKFKNIQNVYEVSPVAQNTSTYSYPHTLNILYQKLTCMKCKANMYQEKKVMHRS